MKYLWLAIFFLASCQTALAIDASDLLARTNLERTSAGLSPLALDSKLTEAANIKAKDMVDNNYWSHISPQGISPTQLLRQVGYKFKIMGENLADGYDSADDVTEAWMNSPGHRRNLLNSKFCDVGFASIGKITVQMLGCQKKI